MAVRPEFTPELIYEGQCPHGHGSLERRENHGWCEPCGYGWSARNGRYTIHNMPGVMVIDGRQTNPSGTLNITAPMRKEPAQYTT